jgi:hypothetical protein
MVQGKANIPQLLTKQLDVMLKAHLLLDAGLCLNSLTLDRSICRTDLSYADDMDGQVSLNSNDMTSVYYLVEYLRHIAQTWSTLTDICGGLIALHKCNWH